MRYKIRAIEGGSMPCLRELGRVVYEGDDVTDEALEVAYLYHYGVAVVDRLNRTIDWGDGVVTDFDGELCEDEDGRLRVY